MSLSRFISQGLGSLTVSRPTTQWSSAERTQEVTAEEDGDILISAPRIIIRAENDLQNARLSFPSADDFGELQQGSEITIIPMVNIATVDPTASGDAVAPAGALTSFTKHQPVRLVLVFQFEPYFKRLWVVV
jgi:hypothetical protein